MRTFEKKEKLYRAVLPPNRNRYLWSKDGSRLSSVAFRNRNNEEYISVDRQSLRTNEECVKDIKSRLQGAVVSVTCEQCWSSQIKIEEHPNERNPMHCGLINGQLDAQTTKLTEVQRQDLADLAVIEFKDF